MFRITAASFVGNVRITKTVAAISAEHALQSVANELEIAGFYAIEVAAA